MVDKVRPLKLESIATGGGMEDSFPTASNPNEDYLSCKGLAIDESDNKLIDSDGSNNIQFTDPNSGTIKLSEILNKERHRELDQLTHNIAETGYTEVTYSGNRPTSIIVWTSVGKTTKIRECLLTYTGGIITSAITKQYDAGGVLVETLTSIPSYTGGRIDNITNTLT